jgi:crotonobetainyl-CoA:carnitine CoA-transferase CaiB-like acyl-CoA transferase
MGLISELKASFKQLDAAMQKVESSETAEEMLQALQEANAISFQCNTLQELLNKQLNYEDMILH